MSTLTKAIVLGFSIGLANSAAAEHFNDRGEDFIAGVKPDLQAQYPVVAVTPSHFNDRGDDYLATAPAGSEMSPATAGAEMSQSGVRVTTAGY